MPVSPVCIDASVVIPMLVDPTHSIHGLWSGWRDSGQPFVAPMLLRYEVTNGLHRYFVSGQRSLEVIESALGAFLDMPIEFQDEALDSIRAASMARRFRRTATYDAHYLAVADRLGTDFWTADRRLVNTIGSELPWVHLAN